MATKMPIAIPARNRTTFLLRGNAATGELLGELTIDPARNYQPTGRLQEPLPEHPTHCRTPSAVRICPTIS
jgi:hypothetical protein